MKKYIFALIAVVASALAMRADDMITVYSLFVNTNSGDKIEYAFENLPVATFDGEDLVISVPKSPDVKYPMADVKNITFVGKEVSGVEDAAISDNIKIVVANDYIRISGIKENATVGVYSVAGSLMASAVSDEEGNVQISIENLAKGVYVVALPGHSFKFVK